MSIVPIVIRQHLVPFFFKESEGREASYGNKKVKSVLYSSTVSSMGRMIRLLMIKAGKPLNVKKAAAMFEARKLMITTYDNRTAEGIYLVDTGSSLDPIYGYAKQYVPEKPFSEFNETTETVAYDINDPPPSEGGYKQIGTRYAGFIQAVR